MVEGGFEVDDQWVKKRQHHRCLANRGRENNNNKTLLSTRHEGEGGIKATITMITSWDVWLLFFDNHRWRNGGGCCLMVITGKTPSGGVCSWVKTRKKKREADESLND